jgi:predicted PurR-regulated permease PerM
MNLRTRLYIIIPTVILIAVFVYFFSSIIAYFLLAAIVSFVGRPIMKALQKVHFKRFNLPNWACALMSLLTVYGTVALLFLLLIPVIGRQAQSLGTIDSNQVIESFEKPISQLEAWMEKYQLEFPSNEPEPAKIAEESSPEVTQRIVLVAIDSQRLVPFTSLPDSVISPELYAELKRMEGQTGDTALLAESPTEKSNRQKARDYIEDSMLELVSGIQISTIFNSFGAFVGNLFLAFFAVSFISFFLLKESHLLTNIILTISPSGYEEKVQTILDKVKPLLTRYFVGVLVEVLLVGSLIAVGLSLLGVENAIFIGLFAGTLNVIPYLGPVIGTILGLILTTLGCLDYDLTSQLLPLLLKVTGVFAVVQLTDNIVFQPFIYASSVKAHPLEIFLVILMASTLAGVPGMILAIPVYTLLRVIAQQFLSEFKVIQSITKDI